MPTAEGRAQTLYDKVFQDHIVDERLDGTILLYIGTPMLFIEPNCISLDHCANLFTDRHLVHEVTSPVCYANYCVAEQRLTEANSKLLRD